MLNMKKGHRPPPVPVQGDSLFQDGPKPGQPGWHEPYVEGFDAEEWEKSESLRSAEALRYELFYKYEDEDDPGVHAFWARNGVRKQLFDKDIMDGKHRYSVHTPLTMTIPGKSGESGEAYPLIYYCHGGMQDPFQAECSGFSLLLQKEPMIIVYANNGGMSNEDALEDFHKITDALKEKGYPVDWSRVYVCGFSSGSDAAESIATQYPKLVAAVSPCPGSNAMYNSLCRVTPEAYAECLDTRVPVLFIGGTADFGDKYPYPDEECIENFNIWAEHIAKVRGYMPITFARSRELSKSSTDPAKKAVGLDFFRTWTQHFEERDWYFGEFYGEEGEPVIRFIVGEGVPHVVTGCHAPLTWEFFKHWSKDPQTGESIYTPVVGLGVR